MAGYDMKPLKWAKAIPLINATQSESDKRKEIAAERHRKIEKIFELGQNWQLKGKNLGEARGVVKIDGRDLTDDEFRYFKNGFMYVPRSYAYSYGKKGKTIDELPEDFTHDKDFMDSYAEGRGFKAGYDGVSIGELPTEFVQNKRFLVGYKKGIEAKANENKESNKRR